jgi:hypothetical protein
LRYIPEVDEPNVNIGYRMELDEVDTGMTLKSMIQLKYSVIFLKSMALVLKTGFVKRVKAILQQEVLARTNMPTFPT